MRSSHPLILALALTLTMLSARAEVSLSFDWKTFDPQSFSRQADLVPNSTTLDETALKYASSPNFPYDPTKNAVVFGAGAQNPPTVLFARTRDPVLVNGKIYTAASAPGGSQILPGSVTIIYSVTPYTPLSSYAQIANPAKIEPFDPTRYFRTAHADSLWQDLLYLQPGSEVTIFGQTYTAPAAGEKSVVSPKDESGAVHKVTLVGLTPTAFCISTQSNTLTAQNPGTETTNSGNSDPSKLPNNGGVTAGSPPESNTGNSHSPTPPSGSPDSSATTSSESTVNNLDLIHKARWVNFDPVTFDHLRGLAQPGQTARPDLAYFSLFHVQTWGHYIDGTPSSIGPFPEIAPPDRGFHFEHYVTNAQYLGIYNWNDDRPATTTVRDGYTIVKVVNGEPYAGPGKVRELRPEERLKLQNALDSGKNNIGNTGWTESSQLVTADQLKEILSTGRSSLPPGTYHTAEGAVITVNPNGSSSGSLAANSSTLTPLTPTLGTFEKPDGTSSTKLEGTITDNDKQLPTELKQYAGTPIGETPSSPATSANPPALTPGDTGDVQPQSNGVGVIGGFGLPAPPTVTSTKPTQTTAAPTSTTVSPGTSTTTGSTQNQSTLVTITTTQSNFVPITTGTTSSTSNNKPTTTSSSSGTSPGAPLNQSGTTGTPPPPSPSTGGTTSFPPAGAGSSSSGGTPTSSSGGETTSSSSLGGTTPSSSGGTTSSSSSGGGTTSSPSGGNTTSSSSGGGTTSSSSGGNTSPSPSGGGTTTSSPSGGGTTSSPSGGGTTSPSPSGGGTTTQAQE